MLPITGRQDFSGRGRKESTGVMVGIYIFKERSVRAVHSATSLAEVLWKGGQL